MSATVAYGLDLAGYYSGKSGLAKATFDPSTGYMVEVYRRHAFAVRREGRRPLKPQIDRERELLKVLVPIYVDVPIDLQGLPSPVRPSYIWQLVKRPVDVAFGALPPLADKLGAPVARMRNLLDGNLAALDGTLFETYPRASLLPLLGFEPRYKRQSAEMQHGKWIGDGDGNGQLAQALSQKQARADEGTRLSDDDFDAAICALTGVLGGDWRLCGELLDRVIRQRLEQKLPEENLTLVPVQAPKGYVLIAKPLSQLPLRIRVVDELSMP